MSDGALCLFPAGFANKEGEPLPLIVRKRDGGFGYATTDLAAIRYRLTELGATRLLYVVGTPQQQHLAMIYQAAKELGWLAPPARAEHVMFGQVLGSDKKIFATRAGQTIRLIDLIDSAIARADAVIQDKLPDLDAATRRELAPKIGVGAIKYADLSSDRIKDYVFDIDRMVAFDGNSAGYVQYAYARIQSILRKAAEAPAPGDDAGAVLAPSHAAEKTLAQQLLGFGAVVGRVEASLEPHHLTGYLYELAMSFSSFYDKCPVLKAEGPARGSRIALARLTGKTIARGLALLGIDAPDRM
jgi:arginyl-tRNA synthetase